MADNLGAIGGPLLALLLVASFDVRTAILLSVVPGLLAAVAILYAVRHISPTDRPKRASPREVVRPLLRGQLGRLLAGVASSSSPLLRTARLSPGWFDQDHKDERCRSIEGHHSISLP
jgi:MFS family permease